MKKKFLISLLGIVAILSLCFGFTACGLINKDKGEIGSGGENSNGNQSSEHTHNYNVKNTAEKYLKSGATCASKAVYYFSCSCGEKGTTTFFDGEQLPHTPVTEEAVAATCTAEGKTEGSHCSVCNTVIKKQTVIPRNGHNFVNGNCQVCGQKKPSNLKYELNTDKDGYIVAGIGGCTDADIIIADIYGDENLPVVAIKNNAFPNCNFIKSFTIPDSVKEIGDSAFDQCTSYKSIYVTDITAWCNISNLERLTRNGNSTKSLYLNNELVTELEIPDGVTKIPRYAFFSFTSLESVKINNGVMRIECGAFYNCDSLKSVTIPDSVTKIEEGAFQHCISLESVTIPDSVVSLGVNAFQHCTSLTSIIIPESVTEIGGFAFQECFSLASINIADSVTSIGRGAFNRCTSLKSVIIPDSVTELRYFAFCACESLESVKIGNGVKSIENETFAGCRALKSVIIPDSVTEIKGSAFSGCSSLEKIYYNGAVEEWEKISIGTSNENFINAMRYYYSETQPTNEGNYWHYVNGDVMEW